jgi:thiamine-monophosphate kinase
VALVGGNVARGRGTIVIDVTLLGDAGRPAAARGARPGDRVVVTGTLGAAAEGVRLLAEGARLDEDGELVATGVWTESSGPAVAACLRAQLDPRPPLALARSIAERGLARAGMDLSDGLSVDLAELCSRSGVGAVDRGGPGARRPQGGGPRAGAGRRRPRLALDGGEDYQLLLAVAPEDMDDVGGSPGCGGWRSRDVGEFVAGEPAVRLRDAAGERPLLPGGHDHLRGGPVRRRGPAVPGVSAGRQELVVAGEALVGGARPERACPPRRVGRRAAGRRGGPRRGRRGATARGGRRGSRAR